MRYLKVLFIGVGSIAGRHIRNLRSICNDRNIELVIDAFRRTPEHIAGVDDVYYIFSDVPKDYDVIFITNPTEFHLDSLKKFHDNGKHFFIEKPVVSFDQIDLAKGFRTRDDSIYYVACPLRYNSVIKYLKDNLHIDDVISVRSISSSYLPEWRPGVDYRKTYSAHRDMGGGVSIDLIHEWDYLTFLFGMPEKIFSIIGKKSQLEIDSDDYAIYISEYKNMIAELHLDYFGRKTIREIQIFTKKDTIVGDIANNKIIFLNKGRTIDFCEERDDFQKREMIYFLNAISEGLVHADWFDHGLDVLRLTQGEIQK